MSLNNGDKLQLLHKTLDESKVERTHQEELLLNLNLSLESIEHCHNVISSGLNEAASIPNINLTWVKSFSQIWESKLSRQEVHNRVDLNRLLIIFRICALLVSSLLKGRCVKRFDGTYSRRRPPLYAQLSCLEAPLNDFIQQFVRTASMLDCATSGFLDLISDLTSIQLENKVLLLHQERTSTNEQCDSLYVQMDLLFQMSFPDSIEPRLDTCLKCASLNNRVAAQVCPFLQQTLDKCRHMQKKLEHISLATYVKFVLLYSRWHKLCRQARLDSTVVLDQALFLPSPVFSSHTRRVQDRLHSILLPGNTRSIIGRNIPPRKMTKMYIDNLKSVTETYKNIQHLPFRICEEQIPTECVNLKSHQPSSNVPVFVNMNSCQEIRDRSILREHRRKDSQLESSTSVITCEITSSVSEENTCDDKNVVRNISAGNDCLDRVFDIFSGISIENKPFESDKKSEPKKSTVRDDWFSESTDDCETIDSSEKLEEQKHDDDDLFDDSKTIDLSSDDDMVRKEIPERNVHVGSANGSDYVANRTENRYKDRRNFVSSEDKDMYDDLFDDVANVTENGLKDYRNIVSSEDKDTYDDLFDDVPNGTENRSKDCKNIVSNEDKYMYDDLFHNVPNVTENRLKDCRNIVSNEDKDRYDDLFDDVANGTENRSKDCKNIVSNEDKYAYDALFQNVENRPKDYRNIVSKEDKYAYDDLFQNVENRPKDYRNIVSKEDKYAYDDLFQNVENRPKDYRNIVSKEDKYAYDALFQNVENRSKDYRNIVSKEDKDMYDDLFDNVSNGTENRPKDCWNIVSNEDKDTYDGLFDVADKTFLTSETMVTSMQQAPTHEISSANSTENRLCTERKSLLEKAPSLIDNINYEKSITKVNTCGVSMQNIPYDNTCEEKNCDFLRGTSIDNESSTNVEIVSDDFLNGALNNYCKIKNSSINASVNIISREKYLQDYENDKNVVEPVDNLETNMSGNAMQCVKDSLLNIASTDQSEDITFVNDATAPEIIVNKNICDVSEETPICTKNGNSISDTHIFDSIGSVDSSILKKTVCDELNKTANAFVSSKAVPNSAPENSFTDTDASPTNRSQSNSSRIVEDVLSILELSVHDCLTKDIPENPTDNVHSSSLISSSSTCEEIAAVETEVLIDRPFIDVINDFANKKDHVVSPDDLDSNDIGNNNENFDSGNTIVDNHHKDTNDPTVQNTDIAKEEELGTDSSVVSSETCITDAEMIVDHKSIEATAEKLIIGERILYTEFETMYNTKEDLKLFLVRLVAKLKNPSTNIYEILNVENRSYRDVLSSFIEGEEREGENKTWCCVNYFNRNQTSEEFSLHEITSFFFFHSYLYQMKVSRHQSNYLFYISYEPQCKCAHCLTNRNARENYCIDYYISLYPFLKNLFNDDSLSLHNDQDFEVRIKCVESETPVKYSRYLSCAEQMYGRAQYILKMKSDLTDDALRSYLAFCVRTFWEVFVGHALEAEFTSSPVVKKKEKYKPLKKRKSRFLPVLSPAKKIKPSTSDGINSASTTQHDCIVASSNKSGIDTASTPQQDCIVASSNKSGIDTASTPQQDCIVASSNKSGIDTASTPQQDCIVASSNKSGIDTASTHQQDCIVASSNKSGIDTASTPQQDCIVASSNTSGIDTASTPQQDCIVASSNTSGIDTASTPQHDCIVASSNTSGIDTASTPQHDCIVASSNNSGIDTASTPEQDCIVASSNSSGIDTASTPQHDCIVASSNSSGIDTASTPQHDCIVASSNNSGIDTASTPQHDCIVASSNNSGIDTASTPEQDCIVASSNSSGIDTASTPEQDCIVASSNTSGIDTASTPQQDCIVASSNSSGIDTASTPQHDCIVASSNNSGIDTASTPQQYCIVASSNSSGIDTASTTHQDCIVLSSNTTSTFQQDYIVPSSNKSGIDTDSTPQQDCFVQASNSSGIDTACTTHQDCIVLSSNTTSNFQQDCIVPSSNKSGIDTASTPQQDCFVQASISSGIDSAQHVPLLPEGVQSEVLINETQDSQVSDTSINNVQCEVSQVSDSSMNDVQSEVSINETQDSQVSDTSINNVQCEVSQVSDSSMNDVQSEVSINETQDSQVSDSYMNDVQSEVSINETQDSQVSDTSINNVECEVSQVSDSSMNDVQSEVSINETQDSQVSDTSINNVQCEASQVCDSSMNNVQCEASQVSDISMINVECEVSQVSDSSMTNESLRVKIKLADIETPKKKKKKRRHSKEDQTNEYVITENWLDNEDRSKIMRLKKFN